jgi:hypothetical protein
VLLKPHVYRLVRLLADGIPIQEAASQLGMSDRGAQSHLLRGRRTVRNAMAQTLGVLAGALACGRGLVPAAPQVAVAVVAATALFVAVPAPGPPGAAAPSIARGTRTEPVRVAQAQDPAVVAATRPGVSRGARLAVPAVAPRPPERVAAPEPARTAIASTPVLGVETYNTDDGHRSAGPVEMVVHCVENLVVTVGYQGC